MSGWASYSQPQTVTGGRRYVWWWSGAVPLLTWPGSLLREPHSAGCRELNNTIKREPSSSTLACNKHCAVSFHVLLPATVIPQQRHNSARKPSLEVILTTVAAFSHPVTVNFAIWSWLSNLTCILSRLTSMSNNWVISFKSYLDNQTHTVGWLLCLDHGHGY